MITADLYQTQSTFTQGSSGEYTAEMTTTWGNTYSTETVNDVSAYWLGYISKDNLPEQYKRGIIYYDEESGKVVIKDIVDKSNFPCTYGSFESYGSVQQRYLLARSTDGTDVVYSNGTTRLFNQLYPEYIGLSYNGNSNYSAALNITMHCVLFDGGGNILNYEPGGMYKLLATTSIQFTYNTHGRNAVKAAYDFLFKNADYVLNINGHNFIITSADLASGTCYLTSDDNYSVRLFLTSYEINMYAVISSSNTYKPMGFIIKTTQSHLGHVYEDTCISNGADSNTVWWHRTGSTSGDGIDQHKSENNPIYTYYFGFNEEIDISEILRIDSFDSLSTGYAYGYTDHVYLHRDNQSGYGARCILTPYFPIDSVQKTFALSIRVDVSGIFTPSYSEYFTYATDVTSNNEFLAKLKTGDITNTAFKNGLREWQYENLQSDDFDEDDIPPYSPEPEPEDDTPDDEPDDMDDAYGDGDEDQDDIVITAPTQFITQYILTASELRTVGSNLWSSWIDPNTDVYKNFLFDFFQDTGTFNITAALDYIISLRVYPFNLAGMTTEYIGVSNGVYMGTGHTNFCSGTIPTLNTVIGYLDAGTLDVNLHVPYKDFRDLYNCSVMAFLPYCGTVELNPVEIIGKKLHAKYFIDFQSGACTAVIRVNNDGVEYTIASKSGQIGFMLPVSATNSGQLAAQYASDATRAIGTLSGLFFDVAGSVGRSAENAIKIMSAGEGGEQSAPTGMTVTESLNIGKSGVKTALGFANQAIDMLSRSGIDMPMLSGGAGAESLFMPPYVCLQVRRGKYAKPNNYPHSVGYYNLSSNPISYYKGAYHGSPSTGSNTGKGFCTFTGVDTSGLDCREDEREEILELLNTGIYL